MMLTALMAGTVSISFGQEANNRPTKTSVGLQTARNDTISPKMEMMKVRKDSIHSEMMMMSRKDSVRSKMIMMKALKDSTAEFHEFKKAADLKFLSNRKNISVLRAKYLKLEATDKVCMDKISKLEQKNSDLEKSLANYKDLGESDWSLFKNRFNDDMDELQNELKALVPVN